MAAPFGDAVPPIDEGAHDREVEAFLPSVPKRQRERVFAKHPVLVEKKTRQVFNQELSWAGDVLDQVRTPVGGSTRFEYEIGLSPAMRSSTRRRNVAGNVAT